MQSSDEEKQTLLPAAGGSASTRVDGIAMPPAAPDAPEEGAKEDKGSTLIVAFLLMLVFQLGNRIFGRLQTYPMHNYPLFLNIVMVAIYIPICFMYIIPAMMWTNNITKEQTEIPKYKFAIMGGYDSLAGIMQTFAINYISNASMIVLVQQSAIPISMVISSYALNSVYTKSQYVGASIVLLGIIVVLIPNMMGSESATASGASGNGDSNSSSQLWWILLLVVSCVPMCLSSVYKEKALGETEIDIMYLNGWVAIFQFLVALPLCIPTGYLQKIPLSQIWPNLHDGMMCWMGVNGVTEEHNPLGLPLDDCSSAPLFVTTYLFFNVVFNFLIIVILKHGSANIMWMASTVIVPLSNVAFSLKFMPGSQPLRTGDLIGLAVIMGGLVVYRFSGTLLSFWATLRGQHESREEEERHKRERAIAKTAEGRQIKFLGINQTEYLESLVETRVAREQMLYLVRSPQQIRGGLYAKLGMSPSPQVMVGPGRRPGMAVNYQATGLSPAIGGASSTTSSFHRAGSLRESNIQLGNTKGYARLNSPAIGRKPKPAEV